MTRLQKIAATRRLKRLWKRHDALEREILLVERRFDDKTLRRLGAAAGGTR